MSRNRLPVAAAALLLAACASAPAPGPSPGPALVTATPEPEPAPLPSAGVDTAAPAPSGGTAMVLDREIVQTGRTAAVVHKMKIRTDAAGAIVKQSIYHGDAEQVPEPVRAAALAKYPKAKILHYETEWYADGGRVYEVEVKTADGKECELATDAEGNERYVECRIAPKKLPSAVAQAVKAAVPGGKILEAEVKTRPEGEAYSVEVKTGDRELYLHVASDGKIIGKHLRVTAVVEIPID